MALTSRGSSTAQIKQLLTIMEAQDQNFAANISSSRAMWLRQHGDAKIVVPMAPAGIKWRQHGVRMMNYPIISEYNHGNTGIICGDNPKWEYNCDIIQHNSGNITK